MHVEYYGRHRCYTPSPFIDYTIRSARDGGRRPAQIPQLDTPQASKKSHNSIHNPPSSVIRYQCKSGKITAKSYYGRAAVYHNIGRKLAGTS